MSGLLTKMRGVSEQFPVIRGMLSYAVIWPTCSITQEYLEHGTPIGNADWARAARFGIFGSLFMAPMFYGWLKFSGRFFKRNDLRTCLLRVAIEQVSYGPFAMSSFLFGINFLEAKPVEVCVNEVKEKFWPTFKRSMFYWPAVQTANLYFVPEKNRIVFAGLASFVWVVFLAHVVSKQRKNELSVAGNQLTIQKSSPSSI